MTMKGDYINKLRKRSVSFVFWLLLAFCCLLLGACMFLQQAKFGKLPHGENLAQVERSAHYRDGQFYNLIDTPKFSQDVSVVSIVWNDLIHPAKRLVPEHLLPAVKVSLHELDLHQDLVVWLGHSSYFIQLGGKRILIDPILSDYAAPFSFLNKAFPGTSIYTADDFPPVNYLLISHDHWDHLDYPTVIALKKKVGQVICPLGVDSYFFNWGYKQNQVVAGDWYDQLVNQEGLSIHLLPARHYSGRGLRQNQTLWGSFVLTSSEYKLFFSGDSGYGPHFKDVGQKLGPFDLVALDSGQYDDRWAYIHMTPEEAVTAAQDLGAKVLLPAHVGRFSISRHAWDEPFNRISSAGHSQGVNLVTPVIGEIVKLGSKVNTFSRWW